jgi:hypothetical protein
VTFVCRDNSWPEESLHIWEAVIPFNACFAHCRGTGPTKQLAKEACALQALPLCQGYASVWDTVYNPMIQLCITGGKKIGRNRTPYICVPRYNFPIEHCAPGAFNVYDAAKRCRENLDKMLSRMAESFDEIQYRKNNDDNDEESDDEEQYNESDDNNDEEKSSTDNSFALTYEMKTVQTQETAKVPETQANINLFDVSELFENQNEPENDEYAEFKEAVRLVELDNPTAKVHCITRKTGENCVLVFSRPDMFSNYNIDIPSETKPKHYDGKPVYYFDTLSLSLI